MATGESSDHEDSAPPGAAPGTIGAQGPEVDDTPGDGDFEPWLVEVAGALAVAVSNAPPIHPGVVLDGRYRVEAKIGAGGMGVVYRALDLTLERTVALKLHNLGIGDISVSRLWREAKAMASLRHPNVVTVHEIGEYAGHMFIAMEYVEVTLRQWLAATPRRPLDIVAMFIDAGRGLAAAHAVGIVHRDFKPDNVLVGSDGRARVGDFGVAQRLTDPSSGDDEAAPSVTPPAAAAVADRSSGDPVAKDARLTVTGAAIGTPAYMAPEQMRGVADARADQFAFCVSLFEALAGRRPYRGRDMLDLDIEMSSGVLQPLPRAVPSAVIKALRRGLAYVPEDRFLDMNALLAALDRARRRGRRTVAVAMIVTACVAGAAVYLAPREQPCADADAPVAAAWDPERRAAIRDAVASIEGANTETIASHVVETIDEHASALAQMRRDTCLARNDPATSHLVDARMACLGRRLDELTAVTAVFVAADAQTLIRADDVLALIHDVDDCADPKRYLTGVTPPTPEQAESVAELRATQARAVAWGRAGKYAQAKAEGTDLLDGARALDYAPLLAEALLTAGSLRGGAMETADADGLLREGFYIALREGHDAVMAEAALQLLSRVAEAGGPPSEIESWFQLARAAQDRSAAPQRDRVRLSTNRAHAYWVSGNIEAALAQIGHAQDDAQTLPLDHPVRRRATWMAARIHMAAGDYAGSREFNRLAFESAIRGHGAGHPEVANVADSFAEVLAVSGRPLDAIALLRVALDIRRSVFGVDGVPTIESLSTLGGAFQSAGDLAAAASAYREAIERAERVAYGDRSLLARLYGNSADTFLSVGDHEEALRVARRADELASDLDIETRARSRFSLGIVVRAIDGPKAALVPLAQVDELLTEPFRGGHPFGRAVDLERARTFAMAGDLEQAERVLLRQQQFIFSDSPPDPMWAGHWFAVRGEWLEAGGRMREAAEAFERAHGHFDEVPELRRYLFEVRLGQSRAWLALGELDRATTELDALLDEITGDPGRAEYAAGTRFTLARARWEQGDHEAARTLADAARRQATGALVPVIDAWRAEHRDAASDAHH